MNDSQHGDSDAKSSELASESTCANAEIEDIDRSAGGTTRDIWNLFDNIKTLSGQVGGPLGEDLRLIVESALGETQAMVKQVESVEQAQADALVNSAEILLELNEAQEQLEEESTRREQVAQRLQTVLGGTADATGIEFFERLVEKIAVAFGVRYALAGKLVETEDAVEVVAIWGDGALREPFRYELKGTPCAGVIEGCALRHHVAGVQASFPEDHLLQEMSIESYMAIPILCDDRSVGLIGILDSVEMPSTEAAHVLQVSAARAAAEFERSAVEAEHVRARLLAEDATRMKNQFLANMSHEIRTPLNGIIGAMSLLTDTGLSVDQADLVETATTSGEALLHVVSDILDLTKIESGGMVLERRAFDPAALLRSVCRIMAIPAESNKVALVTEIVGEVPSGVMGDEDRLRQVLINLVSNALKFDRGGVVRVRLRGVDSVSEDVQSVQEAGRRVLLRYEVQDTGIGIDAEAQARIFDAFTQADASTTRCFGGTGLGLPISRQLVELMEGRLDVKSEAGEGSLFFAEIPFEVAAAGAVEPANCPSTKLQVSLSGRVLLVEDNLINQKIARSMIEASGCTVDIANHGIEALEWLSSQSYDLVLMDCQMPQMDGLEATRKMRSHDLAAVRSLPVIAMTANAFDEDRRACAEAGMNGFLSKPVSRKKLVMLLGQWIPAVEAQEPGPKKG